MFPFAILFLIGDLFLQLFSQLPSPFIVYLITAMAVLCWFLFKKFTKYLFLPLACILGFAWSYWYANSLMSFTLPQSLEGQPVVVTGYIASLPIKDNWQTNFLFSLEKLQQGKRVIAKNSLIRLSWRDANPKIKVGDKWQFHVRLKRIHGTKNPGSFDYEAWSLQKKIRATGYILKGHHTLIPHQWYHYPINQLRQMLQEKIQSHLPVSKTSPWLLALIIGEREGISKEDWQVLRNTGTNHLMAIAGLHIGIMAGFAHVVVTWFWRFFPFLMLSFPAQQAGACGALTVAVLYSALAGFSLPTQRACLMLSIFMIAILTKRKMSAWHSWSFALLLVLFLNPLSVLTESFWLSFGTIALIIYGMSSRLMPSGLWWKWGRVQWVIGMGLTPIALALFQQTSLISFIANSIAIPWLGFLILPFCLLSGVFLLIVPSLGGFFLLIAGKSLAALWVILTWFSQLHFSSWYQAMPNFFILLLTTIGFVLLLLPSGTPGKWIGITWLMPLLFFNPAVPREGDFWITLLDVGQGLSVIVQTKSHLLVYDAGPKFYPNFDMGESVVLPYLRTRNVKYIDMLVISHGDNDHIGGANALLQALPVLSVKTSVPDKLPSSSASLCLAGMSWQWDQVAFSFLYPSVNDLNLGNDSSCVLRIDNGVQRILLTGDIEKNAEINLLSQVKPQLAADILIAPHHGSKTSGLTAFIQAVHPQFVLYATGYRNRYHFPHPTTILAYQTIHAQQLNTVDTGAIHFKIERNQTQLQAEKYRVLHKRYWMD